MNEIRIRTASPLPAFPTHDQLLQWCDWLDDVLPVDQTGEENVIRVYVGIGKKPCMVQFECWCWHTAMEDNHAAMVKKILDSYTLPVHRWKLLKGTPQDFRGLVRRGNPCCKSWPTPKEAWEELAFYWEG